MSDDDGAKPVTLADRAILDLIAIAREIARDNPGRAESFVDELEQKCRDVGDHPLAWPIVRHRANRDILRSVYGNYLIFYRGGPEQVDVIRVLHGARNYAAWLFED